MKISFIICAVIWSLLEKIDTCHNNPQKPPTTKINKHATSGYFLFTSCSFDAAKNKHDYYRGKDCMEKFSKKLKKHAIKIIDCETKEMIPLTVEENK